MTLLVSIFSYSAVSYGETELLSFCIWPCFFPHLHRSPVKSISCFLHLSLNYLWPLQQVTKCTWEPTGCGAPVQCISLILKLREKIPDAGNIYRQKLVSTFHLHLFVLIIKDTCTIAIKEIPLLTHYMLLARAAWELTFPLLNYKKLWLRCCPGHVVYLALSEMWVSCFLEL